MLATDKGGGHAVRSKQINLANKKKSVGALFPLFKKKYVSKFITTERATNHIHFYNPFICPKKNKQTL